MCAIEKNKRKKVCPEIQSPLPHSHSYCTVPLVRNHHGVVAFSMSSQLFCYLHTTACTTSAWKVLALNFHVVHPLPMWGLLCPFQLVIPSCYPHSTSLSYLALLNSILPSIVYRIYYLSPHSLCGSKSSPDARESCPTTMSLVPDPQKTSTVAGPLGMSTLGRP